jgi:hypothetical protein
VQGSASDIVANVHAVWVLAQQRAQAVESSDLDDVPDPRELKQILNDVPLTLVVGEAQRCAVEVMITGMHVRPEFDEQFDGVELTGASGAMQWRFITRFAVHVQAQFHQQAKTHHTFGPGLRPARRGVWSEESDDGQGISRRQRSGHKGTARQRGRRGRKSSRRFHLGELCGA